MQFTALRSTCAVHLRGQEKESSSLWQLLRLQTDQRVMSYTLYIISLYPSRVRNNSIPKCWKYLFITIRYAKFDFFFVYQPQVSEQLLSPMVSLVFISACPMLKCSQFRISLVFLIHLNIIINIIS